jgi:hypothetical protein
MIETGLGHDPLPPPQSAPVQIHGTVALTKINIGGDFPGSHVGDDQNTFIDVDDVSFLAGGNSGVPTSCPGEGCGLVEMEREFKKYPLFAWAGEGDGITAVGRWIFDCGHPDPNPYGNCSNNAAKQCVLDSDCASPGTCTAPPFRSNLRAELHPPHALAVFRNKSKSKTPATRADVYVSTDTGGAGDTCTVTHLTHDLDVLNTKNCFANHCAGNANRSCTVDKDCAGPATCVVFDPNQGGPLVDVNADDFVFDMPLPQAPASGTATLKIVTKDLKPAGGLSPKAIFNPPNGTVGAVTTLQVRVPMSVALKPAKGTKPALYPNVFAQRITAYWKEEKTKLTHVQVAFQSLTIHNPLKAAAPVFERGCANSTSAGVSGTCTTDAQCPAGTCTSNFADCHYDSDCPKKDSCSNPSVCAGGVTPGWEMFGEVNGDWIQFAGLTKVGTEGVFAAAPYIKPSDDPQILLKKPVLKFDEYVPDSGTIHIASTGHGLGCNDAYLYGHNLKDSLARYGFSIGGACFGEGDPNPGRLEVTHTGPHFTAAPANALCTGSGTPADCCTGDGAGTCDSTNDICTGSGAPLPCCTGSGTGECSTVTCTAGAKSSDPTMCTATSGTGDGGLCSGDTTRLCLVDADCVSPQTCNGACSDTGATCHVNANCHPEATCEFGHAFDLTYTIKVL